MTEIPIGEKKMKRKEEEKIEFEWVVDEWVAIEYKLIAGIYRPINRIAGLSLDDVIRMM